MCIRDSPGAAQFAQEPGTGLLDERRARRQEQGVDDPVRCAVVIGREGALAVSYTHLPEVLGDLPVAADLVAQLEAAWDVVVGLGLRGGFEMGDPVKDCLLYTSRCV